jgi:hypothetical protein
MHRVAVYDTRLSFDQSVAAAPSLANTIDTLCTERLAEGIDPGRSSTTLAGLLHLELLLFRLDEVCTHQLAA